MLDSLEESFMRFQLRFMWGPKRREEFYQLMADFTADKIPVFDALEEISKRWISTKNPKAMITEDVLLEMRGHSGEAKSMGEALRKWVPSMEAIAVQAGEQAGQIDNGLRMAASLTGVKATITKTIRGSMAYPIFLMLLLVTFLVGIKIKVIPMFLELLPMERWPITATVLGYLANNIIGFLTTLGVIVFALSVFYKSTRDTWVSYPRSTLDAKVWPWTMHRSVSSAVLMSCFAALLNAGVPFDTILKRMSENATDWERFHLTNMRDRMRTGMNEGDAIATDLFDTETQWLLSVYGKLSSFADTMQSLSAKLTTQLLEKITALMGTIRTIAMITVAVMILWVYMSFIQITLIVKDAAM